MRVRWGLIFLACLSLVGCSKFKATEETAFQIFVPKNANGGAPFHFFAQTTALGDFYLNDYTSIAKMAFEISTESSKEQRSERAMLIPGEIQTIRMKRENPNQPIGLYFLFTDPGEEWKVFFDQPSCKYYKVVLSERGIARTHGY